MICDIPRIMIAASNSGCGKTTFTSGLLSALATRGMRSSAFKCGPDFIDPLFHCSVLGIPSYNLDLFLSSEDTVRTILATRSKDADIAVIEGVMGFFDGLGMDTEASSYHLARTTGTPVILLVDARGASLSLAATVKGFLTLRPDTGIAAVILNRCSYRLRSMLAPAIERECGVPVVGCLPDDPSLEFASRHLGLVTADEIPDVRHRLDHVGEVLAENTDLDALLTIARSASALEYEPLSAIAPDAAAPEPAPAIAVAPETAPAPDAASGTRTTVSSAAIPRLERPVIAVARDAAFCFYYEENLQMLRNLGARVVPFSPIADTALPEDTDAIYLGGGYPELHARELASNLAMRTSILDACRSGMPVLAECGGFLYLHTTLRDIGGDAFPMVGAIDAEAGYTGHLRHFGYEYLTATTDTLLCDAGARLVAHEFHYYGSDADARAFWACKPQGGDPWGCSVACGDLLAGFPHLYFPSNPSLPLRFVRKAAAFGGIDHIGVAGSKTGDTDFNLQER